MITAIRFVWLAFLRACLPFSFLIACVFDPFTMLRNLRELPSVIRHMWDNPI